MEHNRRPSLRRALATLLTAALVAAGAIVGVAAPAQAAAPRTLTATAAVEPGVRITLAVDGAGFEDAPIWPGQAARGTYIAFVEKGNLAFSQSGTPNASLEVTTSGAIAGSLIVPAASLDRTKSYEVIAWPTRSNPSESNLLARTDVTIDWRALFPAQGTSTTVSASPAGPSVSGTSVTFTATVAPTAAGSVSFAAGSTSLGSSTVVGGSASVTTSSLPVGDSSVVASFTPADDSAYAASQSSAYAYTMTAPPTEAEPEPEPAPAPKVTVSKTTGLDAGGETVTVTGTGFVPSAPATNDARPPLAGKFAGAYIVFGSFADVWKPTEGASGAARKTFDTKWGVLAADMATIGGPSAGAIEISADGSFTTTLTVSEAAGALADGNWGVYTYPGGAAKYAPFETYTPISFAAPVDPEPVDPEDAAPKVTVTPASALDPNVANVLTIAGTGFTGAGAAGGAYVLIGEASVWSGDSALPAEGWIASTHVAMIVGGAFSTTLTIPAGSLDPAKTYQVATSAAHALSATNRSLDTFTPVTVQQVAVDPVLTVSGNVVAGGSLSVTGAGFTPGDVIAVEVHSDPYALGKATADASGRFAISGTLPADFPTGAHSVVAIVNGVTVASTAVTVGAAAVAETPAAATCTAQAVSGATISWGVKQSFVSYIDGPIANGSANIAWGSGSGAYNVDDSLGRVGYGGGATFTGHSGLLDLKISNVTIQVTGARTATLSAYVSSAAYGGNAAVNGRVALATLSLPSAAVSGSKISWSGASATLTAAGASAFGGFYTAGTAMDPVSFAFPLGAEVPCDVSTSGELAATGGTTPEGTIWLGLGMLILGAGLVALRRRKLVGAV